MTTEWERLERMILRAPLKDLLLFLRPAIRMRIYTFAINTKKADAFDSGAVCTDDVTWTRRRCAPTVMTRLLFFRGSMVLTHCS